MTEQNPQDVVLLKQLRTELYLQKYTNLLVTLMQLNCQNTDLTCLKNQHVFFNEYIEQKLTDETFGKSLFEKERRCEKSTEILHVLETFVNVATDILQKMVRYLH